MVGKMIVMSDIHMTDGESHGWFHPPYSDHARDMFTALAERSDVSELVLLGDTFDTWLYPVNTVPYTFSRIIERWDGAGSVAEGSDGRTPTYIEIDAKGEAALREWPS